MKHEDGSDKRSWPVVGYYFKGVLEKVDLGRDPLTDRSLIPHSKKPDINKYDAEQLLLILKHANRGSNKALGIIIDEVDSITRHQPKDQDRPECLKITTKHLKLHRIFGDISDYTSVKTSFEKSRCDRDDERCRTFIIATVYTHSGGTFSLADFAFLSTNKEFIPFESHDEYVIAEKAISEKRSFLRDAYFTKAANKPVLTLLDTDEPTDIYIGDGPDELTEGLRVKTHFDYKEPFPEPAKKRAVIRDKEAA